MITTYSDNDIENHLDNVEIQFFDEDPEDDPDRAGDGWYFKLPDEDGWSGAWQSESEAMDEARDTIIERYQAYETSVNAYSAKGSEGNTRFFITLSCQAAAYPYNRIPSWKQPDGTRIALVDAKNEHKAKNILTQCFPGHVIDGIVETDLTLQEFMEAKGLGMPDLQPYADIKTPAATLSP